jgi:hypothetical protein
METKIIYTKKTDPLKRIEQGEFSRVCAKNVFMKRTEM